MQNNKAAWREKARNTNRRNQDGTPRKKIARCIERGEERNAESAIGHGIEQSVTGSGKEKIEPQQSSVTWNARAGGDHNNRGGEKRCENQRVRKAAMAPEVLIADAKMKAHDIGVGQHRAHSTEDPYTFLRPWSVESRSHTERRDRVRDDRRQATFSFLA